MSVPIVCLGCNERAEIPFIPADLTCVACKTGEHIDLDDVDITSQAMLDDLPMMLLPSGVPDQDADFDLLRGENATKRKVTLPEGSAPYSQRALARKQANQDGSADATGDTFTRGDGDDQTCSVDGCDVQVTEDETKCAQHRDGSDKTAAGFNPFNRKGPASAAPAAAPHHVNNTGPSFQGENEMEDQRERNGITRGPDGTLHYPDEKKAASKTAYDEGGSWDHGLNPATEGQVFSCAKDMDCTFFGNAREMEEHYASVHAGVPNATYTRAASLTKQADLAAIRSLLAQFNGKNVTLTYDDDLGLHTVAGTLVYHPPSVMVGKSATTDVHVLQATVNGYGDFPDQRTEPVDASWVTNLQSFPSGATASRYRGEKTAAYDGTGKATSVEDAVSYYASQDGKRGARLNDVAYALACDNATARRRIEFAIDNGTIENRANTGYDLVLKTAKTAANPYVKNCPLCENKGTVVTQNYGDEKGQHCTYCGAKDWDIRKARQGDSLANPQRTKVAQIADAVQVSNPGMPRKSALRLARKTVERYPKVAADTGPDKTKGQMTRQCESCKNRWETNVLAPGAIEPCPSCGHEYSTRTNKRPHDAPAGV